MWPGKNIWHPGDPLGPSWYCLAQFWQQMYTCRSHIQSHPGRLGLWPLRIQVWVITPHKSPRPAEGEDDWHWIIDKNGDECQWSPKMICGGDYGSFHWWSSCQVAPGKMPPRTPEELLPDSMNFLYGACRSQRHNNWWAVAGLVICCSDSPFLRGDRDTHSLGHQAYLLLKAQCWVSL